MSCLISSLRTVIELVEMTLNACSGFDKLNHRISYLLDSPFFLVHGKNL